MPRLNRSKPGSNFWRDLCAASVDFQKNIIWRVNCGMSVNFWEDNWIPHSGPLLDIVLCNIEGNEKQKTFVDYVFPTGEWSLEALVGVVDEEIMHEIHRLIPLNLNARDDVVAWSKSSDGTFNMSFAFDCLREIGANESTHEELFK